MELFDFSMGSTHWRYTSAAYDVVKDGVTYDQIEGLKAGGIETARNVLRAMLEIEVPWSCPLAQEFVDEIPDGRIALVMYRGHHDRWVTYWQGYLRTANFRAKKRCLMPCSPVASDLGYGGLCLRPGKLCQVPLYSALCGVTESEYTVSGVVGSVDGDTVTSATFAAQADGYWVGGNFTSGGVTRMIVSHTTDTVELSGSISALAAGAAFTASAGCDHTHTTCAARFDNLLNQKGYRFMSTRNPFIEGVL